MPFMEVEHLSIVNAPTLPPPATFSIINEVLLHVNQRDLKLKVGISK